MPQGFGDIESLVAERGIESRGKKRLDIGEENKSGGIHSGVWRRESFAYGEAPILGDVMAAMEVEVGVIDSLVEQWYREKWNYQSDCSRQSPARVQNPRQKTARENREKLPQFIRERGQQGQRPGAPTGDPILSGNAAQ